MNNNTESFEISSRLLLPEPNTKLLIVPISSRIIPKPVSPIAQQYINVVPHTQSISPIRRKCHTGRSLRTKSHVRNSKVERDIEELLDFTTKNDIPVPDAHILPPIEEIFPLELNNFATVNNILSSI